MADSERHYAAYPETFDYDFCYHAYDRCRSGLVDRRNGTGILESSVPGVDTSTKLAYTYSFLTTIVVLLATVVYLGVSGRNKIAAGGEDE